MDYRRRRFNWENFWVNAFSPKKEKKKELSVSEVKLTNRKISEEHEKSGLYNFSKIKHYLEKPQNKIMTFLLENG
jgi:hypothetical protein